MLSAHASQQPKWHLDRFSVFAQMTAQYTDYTVDATHSDLQVAVDRLIEWAKKWQLQISIPKCSAFRTDNTQWNTLWNANEVANLTYNIDGYVLPFTDHIRDLGVYHDSRLKYDEHIIYCPQCFY